MKRLLSIPALCVALALALAMGCASFSTNTFRTEQAAVNLAYTAYVGYTSAIPVLNLTADQSNAVKHARLSFASSVSVLDAWRVAYETNSINQPYVQAALDAVLQNSSNLVWTITYIRTGGKP